jgi:DNA polymerase-1
MLTSNKTIYLVDGSAYIYRAYHAITPLTNDKGLPTHAALGFINTILRILREKTPTHMAICFDMQGPTFRHDMYDAYKANRPSMPDDLSCQIPYIHKLSAANGIPILMEQGVEADDIIASAARHLQKQGHRVVVVSGDKDLLLLSDTTITNWEPMKNVVMDQEFIKQKYGVDPDILLDYFALIGDTADNIPGVPGVGPVTARKLLTEYGTLDHLLANLDLLKKSKLKDNLIENGNMAILSRDLIRLKEDVPVPERLDGYEIQEKDPTLLHELYSELGFSKLLKESEPVTTFPTDNFHTVATPEELKDLCDTLTQQPFIVIDTETTSLSPIEAKLVGISLTISGDSAWYLPLGHRDINEELLPGQLDFAVVKTCLGPVLANPDLIKIGHNIKYDYRVLLHNDLPLAGTLFDTMLASYVIDPARRTQKLDDLALAFLGLSMTSFKEVTGGDKRDSSFSYVGIQEATNYSCEDVVATYLLWKYFHPIMADMQVWDLFTDLETPVIRVLAEMEENGIMVDPQILQGLSEEFSGKIDRLESAIFAMTGETFNINSPKQLGTILFDKLGLPHGKKTKTGYSTDVKVLEKLASSHEVPALILEHRSLAKLKSTYVDKLQLLIQPQTGRIHTSFNQAVAATGRLSSSNPNLQNIPIRTEEGQRIREAFIAPPSSVFVAADYSQIDLRVLAHYSQDAALLKAFRSGQDIHSQTAGEIFRVHPTLLTAEMRRVAKTINFGIVYGMSAFGLASQLKISRKEAQTFIDRYFDLFSGVKQYMQDIVEEAREQGFVSTLMGRRRPLPDINAANKNRREFAERTAINSPIQGTAADIMKQATIDCANLLHQRQTEAKMVLQIHDEIVFEMPEDETETLTPLIKEAMESAYTLDVPLIVNISTGANLANPQK